MSKIVNPNLSLSSGAALLIQNLSFKDKLLITPAVAGNAIGLKPQTVYNMLNENRFPLPVVEPYGRRMCRVVDLIAYVDKLDINPTKRGRKSKASKFEKS